jgi:hypothetical protein
VEAAANGPAPAAAGGGWRGALRARWRGVRQAAKDPAQRAAWGRTAAWGGLAGLAGGLMGSLTGMGGPPLMLLYELRRVPKETVRGARARLARHATARALHLRRRPAAAAGTPPTDTDPRPFPRALRRRPRPPRIHRSRARAGTNAVLNVLQFRALVYAALGLFVASDAWLYAATAAASLAGLAAGGVLAARVDGVGFSRILLALMLICCALMFAAASGLGAAGDGEGAAGGA